MGCGGSKEQPADADQPLEAVDNNATKILLLGPGESGKTTFLKQLKLVYNIAMTEAERSSFISSIKRNAAQSMQILVDRALNVYKTDLGSDEDKARAAVVSAYDISSEDEFSPQLADAIFRLWQNPVIKQTFELRHEFWILEASAYYFEAAPRIAAPNYEPTEEDAIMTRVVTLGISTTVIDHPSGQFNIVDVGGQRTERRKWMHCFDNVKSIVFIVNLADYANVLFEDSTINRMSEALRLFEQTINNPLFTNTPVYLLFNKHDLFAELIKHKPLNTCKLFSDFEGPAGDAKAGLDYVAHKFRATVRTGEPSRVHFLAMSACFRADVKDAWHYVADSVSERKEEDAEPKVVEGSHVQVLHPTS